MQVVPKATAVHQATITTIYFIHAGGKLKFSYPSTSYTIMNNNKKKKTAPTGNRFEIYLPTLQQIGLVWR